MHTCGRWSAKEALKYGKARGPVVDSFLSLPFAARKHSLDVLGQNVELDID
jgi:hypothetical protein